MRKFENEYTKEISFPLGGIGTGSIGLAGNGRLMDWEIFNKPNKGSINGYSHFAIRAIDEDGKIYAKVLCGDILKDYIGQYSKKNWEGYGYGVERKTMAGFPHFSKWKFESEFPFAKLTFYDDDFPAEVILHAFNPFIPMDEDNSSIPAAFFEIEVQNKTDREMRFSVVFCVNRPFIGSNTSIKINGRSAIFLQSSADKKAAEYADMTAVCAEESVQLQEYWYRGWSDPITTYWREFSQNERFISRTYDQMEAEDMCTLCAEKTIASKETDRFRFLLSWNAPNHAVYWEARKEDGSHHIFKNYYATLWEDSRDSSSYALKNWGSLLERSRKFSDAVSACTIDQTIMDVATANLCILKSPTVVRLEDGSLWGWEGVHELAGSCMGTCNHVWTYTYALPFLFPRLERSLRENDYKYNFFENGMMAYRMRLPAGIGEGAKRPCVDGQMGGIIKVYREWKIFGDTDWLRSIWARVKKSLEYAWEDDGIFSWDANRDGVLEGRQHHTLDRQLFGPSAWLEGFYLAALKAAAEMADALGEHSDAAVYRELFEKGSKWTEENLFNGEYYVQKIDLKDRSILERFGVVEKYWNEETGEIKYQIGNGCEIDQLVAQWHAAICGLGDIFDKKNRKIALKSLYKNNFKRSMRNIANAWRVFAVNDEAGTIICDYPEGVEKPTIPIPYCEECMSGFEYALAGLMLSEGMIAEAMDIISALHERYNGSNRNPFAEIECGNNYARSMASWSFISILSGFKFDMTRGVIGFFPIIESESFTSFWSCGNAWGTVEISSEAIILSVIEGTLSLNAFEFDSRDGAVSVECDGKSIDFERTEQGIVFADKHNIAKELHVIMK